MRTDLDVAVVGAGPSGLAVAYALQKAGRSVQVFEAADRVGGRMATLRENGYVIDTGAEMIATYGYPATWKLIDEVGMYSTEAPRVANAVSLWRNGRLHANAGRPRGLLTGAGLTIDARKDLLRFQASLGRRSRAFDAARPQSTPLGHLTVAQAIADYDPELRDFVFGPLVGGFFGWQIDRSAAAPLAIFLLTTKSTRSLRTYRDGMDTLARRIAEKVAVETGRRINQVTSLPGGSALLATDAGVISARAVALCVPAPVALDLHANAPHDELRYLESCTYAPMLRVSFALDRRLTYRDSATAYVLLVPAAENPVIAAVTIDHNKDPNRAPKGRGLVSVITHPAATRELLGESDATIVDRLGDQAQYFVPGLRRAITAAYVHRFPNGLPEVTPASLRGRAAFLRRPLRAVDYGGDWLMAAPNSEAAFRSAELTVERILAHGALAGAEPPAVASAAAAAGQSQTNGRPVAVAPAGRLAASRAAAAAPAPAPAEIGLADPPEAAGQ